MKFKQHFWPALVGCLFIASSPLKAGYFNEYCSPFDGFYLGVAAGPETQRADAEIATTVVFPDTFAATIHTVTDVSDLTIDQIQPFGEIFGGWGRQWSKWVYVGGRLGVNFSSFHITSANTIVNNDVDSEFFSTLSDKVRTRLLSSEFTFDLKPGVVFCQRSMLFGIIGGAYTNEKLNGESAFVFTNMGSTVTSFNSVHLEKSKTFVGIRYGFGLETFLYKCLSLQVSYIYTDYPKFTVSGTGNVTNENGTVPGGYGAKFSTKPSKQLFSLGLAWYF